MPRRNQSEEINELAAVFAQLSRRLRSAAATESQELSWAQMAVMSRLARQARGTTADLARAEGMQPQSMRAIVAALEDKKLIVREQHPTDGRQVCLRLSAKGQALRESVRSAKQTWLAQAFSQLSRQDQATLLAAGDIIKSLVER